MKIINHGKKTNILSNKRLLKPLISSPPLQTDFLAMPDYPHPTPESKQAWLDYRQALRDLPANTTDPLNPVWPEAPTP